MANPHGTPIWYELLTDDQNAAETFYAAVLGWTIAKPDMGPPGIDYRVASAADGPVGGIMKKPEGAPMPPAWLIYFGVNDVDAATARAKDLGAADHMPPMDIPEVGRMAFLADPQGCFFYVMRGFSPQDSRAFQAETGPVPGHCVWNELATPDQDGALAFYGDLLGFRQEGAFPMGDLGDYKFWHVGETRIGAVMPRMPGGRTGWQVFFGVDDIDAAKQRLDAAGGNTLFGPSEIPGGAFTIVCADPQGAQFGLVGPRKA
ncbi:VOC family protein [Jiella sonneratiae]|uniref:VOC family protein n=1 Tax=Jiella sonneratiae TaxID=2816856 RepID=A0ABS3JAM4_9HYPH|nr:VOC family protein [Jiella sonneratiae]MBO0906202.1 VOC family protein [Jiella sonneratiae]